MPEPLTTNDLKALRKASSIVFHYSAIDGTYIRATTQHDPGDGFGPRDLTRDIAIDRRITTYERPAHIEKPTEPTKAFWSMSSAIVDSDWQTVAHLLRTGDLLTAHWFVGNNTDRLRAAGLSAMEFRLEVERTSGGSKPTGRKYSSFLLGYTVEGTNSLPSVSYV